MAHWQMQLLPFSRWLSDKYFTCSISSVFLGKAANFIITFFCWRTSNLCLFTNFSIKLVAVVISSIFSKHTFQVVQSFQNILNVCSRRSKLVTFFFYKSADQITTWSNMKARKCCTTHKSYPSSFAAKLTSKYFIYKDRNIERYKG